MAGLSSLARVAIVAVLAVVVAVLVGLLAGRDTDEAAMVAAARSDAEQAVADLGPTATPGTVPEPDGAPDGPTTVTTATTAAPKPESEGDVTAGTTAGPEETPTVTAEDRSVSRQPVESSDTATRDGAFDAGGVAVAAASTSGSTPWDGPLVIRDPGEVVPGVDPGDIIEAFDGHDVVVDGAIVLVRVDPVVVAVPVAEQTKQGFAVLPALVALLGVLAGGLVAGLGRRDDIAGPATTSGSTERPDGPFGTPPSPSGPVAATATPGPDWDNLVAEVIGVRDLVPSEALAGRLGVALAGAGVTEVDPIGERFDPARHRAVRAESTTDRALVGIVAATERIGYDGQGRHVRLPDVSVYQARSDPS